MKQLESLINFKSAIANKKPIDIVEKRFNEYIKEYDNLEDEPTIADKIRHNEAFVKYMYYITRIRGD